VLLLCLCLSSPLSSKWRGAVSSREIKSYWRTQSVAKMRKEGNKPELLLYATQKLGG